MCERSDFDPRWHGADGLRDPKLLALVVVVAVIVPSWVVPPTRRTVHSNVHSSNAIFQHVHMTKNIKHQTCF